MSNQIEVPPSAEPLDVDNVPAEKTCRKGLHQFTESGCGECQRECNRKWYQQHREQLLDEKRKWRQNNLGTARERERNWRQNNPEKVRGKARRHYQKNTEKRYAYTREWFKRNPEKLASYTRKAKYGLTAEQYQALITTQGNACAICREPFTKTPHVDHNHTTGVVRELLCRTCNILIGYLEHERRELGLAYLKKHEAAQGGGK